MIPLILALAGGAGGALKQNAANKRSRKIMEGVGDRRFGIERMYGGEQDNLIKALSAGKTDQTDAQASVARTDLGRQLQAAANSGGQAGTRAAMFSGGEAETAGRVGQGAAQELVGNMSNAGNVSAQALQDAENRRRLQVEAKRLYDEAKDAKSSVLMGALKGAGNALGGYFAGGGGK